MTRPQPGIFAKGSTAHYALEYTVGGDGAALAAALRGFDKLGSAPGSTAPATQRDLIVWLHGDTISDVYEAALAASRAMAPVGTPDLDLRSFPYGDISTKGLYFMSFACDLACFDAQLQRMYGISGDGLKDRITEFSVAITGSYWYAPSEDDVAAALGG
tara:strand:- start:23 stop:499 length:477 start_codon:yes stop_codon:yes gene_type:complete